MKGWVTESWMAENLTKDKLCQASSPFSPPHWPLTSVGWAEAQTTEDSEGAVVDRKPIEPRDRPDCCHQSFCLRPPNRCTTESVIRLVSRQDCCTVRPPDTYSWSFISEWLSPRQVSFTRILGPVYPKRDVNTRLDIQGGRRKDCALFGALYLETETLP